MRYTLVPHHEIYTGRTSWNTHLTHIMRYTLNAHQKIYTGRKSWDIHWTHIMGYTCTLDAHHEIYTGRPSCEVFHRWCTVLEIPSQESNCSLLFAYSTLYVLVPYSLLYVSLQCICWHLPLQEYGREAGSMSGEPSSSCFRFSAPHTLLGWNSYAKLLPRVPMLIGIFAAAPCLCRFRWPWRVDNHWQTSWCQRTVSTLVGRWWSKVTEVTRECSL